MILWVENKFVQNMDDMKTQNKTKVKINENTYLAHLFAVLSELEIIETKSMNIILLSSYI